MAAKIAQWADRIWTMADRHVVSPTVFGNISGIVGNVGGRVAVAKAARRSSAVESRAALRTHPEGALFRSRHSVSLGVQLDPHIIESMAAKFDRIVSDDARAFLDRKSTRL